MALDFINTNMLFENERGYIRTIIKDCLDEDHSTTIEDIWQSLRFGLDGDVAYKIFWQNYGESHYESERPQQREFYMLSTL